MDDCFYILIILFEGFSVVLGETTTTSMIEDTSQKDKILFDGSLAAIETRSDVSCVYRCGVTDRCMSVFYKSDTKQCVLHKFVGGYLKLQQSITTSSSGWKYYEKGLGVSIRSEKCLTNGFEYEPVVDVCYIIQTMDVDFNLIKQQCANLNSELIKITSQEKQDWIISKLTTNKLDWICIQGNNENNMTEFRFDDGTPMTYFKWNTPAGQPQGGIEHYIFMRMSADYKWHDVSTVFPGRQCAIVCEM